MDDAAHTDAHEDGYAGQLIVRVNGQEIAAHAQLRGYFEPIDGRYHWYGRIDADDQLTTLAGSARTAAEIVTPHGSAEGHLSDADPWGRLRISGLSTPPFPIATSLADVEPQSDLA